MPEEITGALLYMSVKQMEPEREMVQCKDCKYYIPYEWMFDGIPKSSNIADYDSEDIGCQINDHHYAPDGFCSFAERREKDQ